jgi:hypothetical protein
MKKSAILLFGLLAITLTACAANTATPTESTGSSAASETSEPTAAVSSEPTEGITPQTEQPTSTPAAQSEDKPNDTATPATSRPSSIPAATEKPSVTSQSPTPTAPPKADPPVTETPVPTEPPKPTDPPAPAFDINDWIAFAKSYGQQIGLIYDEGTTGSWDTPIPASATSKYLERDIKAGLNFAKNMNGAAYFSVWYEDLGGGKYNIFIGYA